MISNLIDYDIYQQYCVGLWGIWYDLLCNIGRYRGWYCRSRILTLTTLSWYLYRTKILNHEPESMTESWQVRVLFLR